VRIQFQQHSPDCGIHERVVVHFFYEICAHLVKNIGKRPKVIKRQLSTGWPGVSFGRCQGG